MAPAKRHGKQVVDDEADHVKVLQYDDSVKKGSETKGPEEDEDFPRLNPAWEEQLRAWGMKHTRQLIRPVEPNSFSPPRVEECVKEIMRSTYQEGWRGPADVDSKTFLEWFQYFVFNTKWKPEDDASITSCFIQKCLEILAEDFGYTARQLSQVPNVQSSRYTAGAVKSNRNPNRLNHKGVDNHEYYSAPAPARNEYPKSKRAKREKLVEEQNTQGDNFSNRREISMLHSGLLPDNNAQATVPDKGYKKQKAAKASNSSRSASPKERDLKMDSQLIDFASVLGEAISIKFKGQINIDLPSIGRELLEEFHKQHCNCCRR